MTSGPRLGSKERSSFLFFRRQNNVSEISSDSLAHHLPDFSPIDTRSFAGLFDEFMSNDSNDLKHTEQLLQTVKPPVNPAPRPPPAKALETKVDHLKVDINRHDSTASSCYSQPSQRDSDYSPLVTRQSSSSSYTPAPSPAVTARQKPTALTIPKRPAHTVSSHLTESPVSAQTPPARTKSSLIRVVSMPPNLDKPLPPGPRGAVAKPSASIPDLRQRLPPAELPSDLPIAEAPPARNRGLSSHAPRMASARRGSDGGAITQVPTWSSQSVREPRSGKAVGHYRNRSASDTEAPRHGRLALEPVRRHTVDMLKLASTVGLPSRTTQSHRKNVPRPITAATAERVIYKIMCSAHTAQDLQATAMVSKGFYRTFHRNESKLVSHLMFKTSKPAWELRRAALALKDSNNFLLKDYRRDCRTLEALKAFIVAHCSARYKPHTLVGLLGQDEIRTTQIDDALWRIWTFCLLFGNAVGQSGPAQTEIDWLNGTGAAGNKQPGTGFGIGNGAGLTVLELEDMNEMWQSLQVLVSGFHGREQEAKQYGIFDNWHLRETSTDAQHLAEWTSYLLAQGPQTILTLCGCSFDQAKMLGLTSWSLPPAGRSRSTFLTSSISQVYQERVLKDATRRAAQLSLRRSSAQVVPMRAPSHRPTRSLDGQFTAIGPAMPLDRLQTQSLRINTSAMKRRPVATPTTNVKPNATLDIRPDHDPASARMDIRPDCDPAWTTSPMSSGLPTSPSADPTVYHSLAMTATVSARLGATLFPIHYDSPAPRVPFPAPERTTATVSEVVDPVDKAMNVLVRELGFPETRARKALAMCDSGSGIDLQKAIEVLTVDAKDARQSYAMPVELPTPCALVSPSSTSSRTVRPSKPYCDGHCKRTPTSSHSRNHSTATTNTATDASVSPISVRDENEWNDKISPLAGMPTATPRMGALNRVSTKARAWKVLGLEGAPKRKNSVLRIDEYQAKVQRKKSMRAASNGDQKVKEGLSKNLLGLGLGLGSSVGAKTAQEQLDRARDDERRRKERSDKSKTSCMPRYA